MGDSTDRTDNDVKARASQSLALRFFVLPPVEKRRMAFGFISKSFRPPLTKNHDDTYIYYLIAERSFVATIAFSAFLLASYVFRTAFNFHIFTIYTNPYDLAGSAGWAYSHIVSTLLFLIFLPYAWLLFLANVDFNSCDLLHRHNRLTEDQKRGWPILWRMFLTVGFIGLVAYCSSVTVNYVISEYDTGFGKLSHLSSLHSSYSFFLITLAFLAWLYGFIPSVTVMACAIGYQHLRRLGPRYRQNIPSPEQSTHGDFR